MVKLVIPLLVACLAACAKPKYSAAPCELDLGYSSGKLHLANVQYLGEDRAIDWFEIYQNLESRRSNRPAPDCIPVGAVLGIEQMIERREHALKNLR